MSVYKRTYRSYTGPVTSDATRFGVLVRYALLDVWQSRVTNILFTICLVPLLFFITAIYAANNEVIRALIANGNAVPMDQRFFIIILQAHCWLALSLTAWVAPRLIAIDMSNNALPILLSHPISRTEYVLAKFAVLAGFLSVVTWIPCLLMFFFQSHMSARPWAADHWHIGVGMLVGSLIWIVVLCFISLSTAAWVKWRIVATGLIFAAMFIPAGMGTVFNAVMRTNWGHVINIPFMMNTLWGRLLQVPRTTFYSRLDLPTYAIAAALGAICFGCVMALNARIRAREVVRG